jgi:hypothetical protein
MVKLRTTRDMAGLLNRMMEGEKNAAKRLAATELVTNSAGFLYASTSLMVAASLEGEQTGSEGPGHTHDDVMIDQSGWATAHMERVRVILKRVFTEDH